jgi:hypothetical protein
MIYKCRAMDIKESYWEKKLRELALDRYCQRVLEDGRRVLVNREIFVSETDPSLKVLLVLLPLAIQAQNNG